MTNEELQATADALGKQVVEMCYEDYPAVRAAEVLEPALRTLVSETYDRAARAQCLHCGGGVPAEFVTLENCPPLAEIGELPGDTGYIHRRDGRVMFSDRACDASNIHALKDSLAPETVSSS